MSNRETTDLHVGSFVNRVFVYKQSAAARLTVSGGKGLKHMGRTDIVPHGFRSTFRDFVAEKTDFPREVAEAALAHALQDKTEAAYQRGDYLEKRRELMTLWADFCMSG